MLVTTAALIALTLCCNHLATQAMLTKTLAGRGGCRRCYPKILCFSSISDSVIPEKELKQDDDNKANGAFNPLGPPNHLAALQVGEFYKVPLLGNDFSAAFCISITRLSRNPDVFLARDFCTSKNVKSLMDAAKRKGLHVAGTRKSSPGAIRKKSYLTWLGGVDDGDDFDEKEDKEGGCSTQKNVVPGMTELAKLLFMHESLERVNADDPFVVAEDIQIAKYDSQGSFDLHHDGFNRFLTVLTYLNGVGGTFFPLARTKRIGSNYSDDDDPPQIHIQKDGSIKAKDCRIGRDGLLIVGSEGENAYLEGVSATRRAADSSNPAIVNIQAGDAIVFYNYHLDEDRAAGGEFDNSTEDSKDWRSLHAGLSVPQEKWIATNWFRSDVLTGPFGHLYKQRLLLEKQQQ